MKKNLVYAMMLVAAMSSCSKDSDAPSISNQNGNVIDDTTPVQMLLTAGVNTTVITRGSGIVGDTIGNDNIWNGQTLNIYAYCDTINGDYATSKFEIDNKQATMRVGNWSTDNATMGETNVLRWLNQDVLYYPLEGKFNFYGYHVDDAATGITPTVNANDVTLVGVTIDGTQDLMIAEAILTKADSIKLYNNDNPANTISDGNITAEQRAAITTESLGKVYSAWSGRRNVQPNLQFKHLLSSFKFQIKAGKANMKRVFIDSIVIEGQNIADMVVLAKGDKIRGLENLRTADGTLANFLLRRKIGENLEIPKFSDTDTLKLSSDERYNIGHGYSFLASVINNETTIPTNYDTFGAGMMLFPGTKTFDITIYTSEYVLVHEGNPNDLDNDPDKSEWQFSKLTRTINVPVKEGNADVFEAGKMYFINLTVFDRQRIDVSATLTPWVNGGNINESLE